LGRLPNLPCSFRHGSLHQELREGLEEIRTDGIVVVAAFEDKELLRAGRGREQFLPLGEGDQAVAVATGDEDRLATLANLFQVIELVVDE
jgi:hypothetical protein